MKKTNFCFKTRTRAEKEIVFFFKRRSCFPWYREWRMKRGKTFGEEKFAGRVSEEEQERCSGSR